MIKIIFIVLSTFVFGMIKRNIKGKIVAYETSFVKVSSVEQAIEEANFLRKAYFLGMYNKIFYNLEEWGGFVEPVNAGNLERLLGKIIDDAKKGRLPSRYSIGLNVSSVKKEK